MKVELIGKYNMSIGTVLLVTANDVLNVGDVIQAGDEEYTIKGFLQPTGLQEDKISIIV